MTGNNAKYDVYGTGSEKRTCSIVITAGQTTSDFILLADYTIVAIQTPVGMTGTSISFLDSLDNGATDAAVVDQTNTAITCSVDATLKTTKISPAVLDGLKRVKLVSNAVEAADRLIYLILARYRN